PEERRLPRPVRPDHPDDPARRQLEVEPVDQHALPVRLLEPLDRQHLVPEARPGREPELDVPAGLLALLGLDLVVARDARLALRGPRLRRRADPLELALEDPLPRRLLLLLHLEPPRLRLEEPRVRPLEHEHPPAVELGHLVRRVLEE